MTRQRVDLPAPFRPITASTLPLGTTKEMSRNAGMSCWVGSLRWTARRMSLNRFFESIQTR